MCKHKKYDGSEDHEIHSLIFSLKKMKHTVHIDHEVCDDNI